MFEKITSKTVKIRFSWHKLCLYNILSSLPKPCKSFNVSSSIKSPRSPKLTHCLKSQLLKLSVASKMTVWSRFTKLMFSCWWNSVSVILSTSVLDHWLQGPSGSCGVALWHSWTQINSQSPSTTLWNPPHSVFKWALTSVFFYHHFYTRARRSVTISDHLCLSCLGV